MRRLRKWAVSAVLVFLPVAVLFPAFFSGQRAAAAEESSPWATAAEAEAARVAAEEEARAFGAVYNEKNELAEAAEEEADEAEWEAEALAEALEEARAAAGKADAVSKADADSAVAAAEEAWAAAQSLAAEKRRIAENARREADAAYQNLADAAMVLKEATEASVRMFQAEAIDSNKISATFRLGETYQGMFNEEMEPVYLRFVMEKAAKVRFYAVNSSVGISVLNSQGSTILTLIPSSTGTGSLCSLEAGEYTFLVSAIGTNRSICFAVEEREEFSAPETDAPGETEMETLVEFDD